MPRVLRRPKFKPDQIVNACEAFSASVDYGDGPIPVVINPSQDLRGDDPVVQALPHFFHAQGDVKARAEYFEQQYAEQAAERDRQKAEEAEQRETDRERIMALADRLEVEERKRREQEERRAQAADAETLAQRRSREKAELKRLEDERIRIAAEFEVARRLEGAA